MAHRRAKTNPFTRLLADAIERARGTAVVDYRMRDILSVREGDVVHLHWFASLYHGGTKAATLLRSYLLELYFLALRARGALLFWTVNNVVSHDAAFPGLETSITRRLAHRFDGFFAFGEETAERLTSEFGVPKERVSVVPHGSYCDYYPRGAYPSIRERYRFDDGPVFLFFGLLRPYKGLENLISAFNDGRHNLLIVGGGAPEYASALSGMNRSGKTVIDVRRVADDEIPSLFESADAVVLPFDSITMSGSMVLALSYGRFVITVDDGDVPSYIRDGANGYLMPDNAPGSIRAAVERTDLLPPDERSAWARSVEEKISWASIGALAGAAYDAAAERRCHGR